VLRITGQLIEATTGSALWAERFDGSIEELFDLQDRVAARVVGALQPQLERAEIARAQRKPTGSLDAYDHYLRGLAELHRWTREANAAALGHFYRAIDLDPNFAAAYGLAARCYSQRRTSNWVEDQAREQAEAEALASKAAALGYDDPVALSSAGIALAFVAGRVREGGELIERALLLNPGLATAWLYSGWVKAWACEPDAAIGSLSRAIELSPHDPNIASMHRAIAFAHFIAGRYPEAVREAEAVATASQNAGIGSATLAASFELMGRHDLAAAEMARLTRAEPELCLANLRTRFPIVRDETFDLFCGALQRAGLPTAPGFRR
jgi:tetratricopeptide (TPR) repeat protein